MDQQQTLTLGQRAVIESYLASYAPVAVEEYNSEKHILIDTHTMVHEMSTMCRVPRNLLADYLAQRGYAAHFEKSDAISGWILEEI